jgi:hypothetical protein
MRLVRRLASRRQTSTTLGTAKSRREPYRAPEAAALHAGWLSECRAGPGLTISHNTGSNEGNDYCNEANDQQRDREAGE